MKKLQIGQGNALTGVRPSSGAAMSLRLGPLRISNTVGIFHVAAPEDGRAPDSWSHRFRLRWAAGCMARAFLLLNLLLNSGVFAQEFSDNVVIVLDASGSMRDVLAGSQMRKMDAAKTALKSVLQKVPPTTQLGLLVFSAAGVKDHWVYPLGPRNDEALTQAIDRLEPSGDTPLGKYIKIGADRLLEARAKQFGYGSYRLLVVTDGEAQDRPLVDRFTPDVMSRGITMDVIGVGMSQDHTLAKRVHSYRRANDPEALNRALTEVFAELGGSANDVAQAESFEFLEPIPMEVAATMIQALSTSGNHPIGTKATSQPRSRVEAASPSVSTPSPSPQPPPPAAPQKRSFTFWIVIGIAVFLILIKAKGRR